MVFLTVDYNGADGNSYFAGTDQGLGQLGGITSRTILATKKPLSIQLSWSDGKPGLDSGLDWTGLWTGLDWTGLWTGLDWFFRGVIFF